MAAVRWFVAAVLLTLPAAATAQQIGPAPPEPFRKWDIGGGVGIRFGETNDAVVPIGSWTVDGSRYWTPHFKTSAIVTTAGQTSYGYQYDPVAFRSIQTERTTRPAAYGVSVGYQFFDNEFVHPYLSAGLRFASAFTETTVQSTKAPYQQLSSAATEDRLQVRPVLGGGFKSYFGNGRAFMRTELLLAIGPNGTPHTILQFGSGVDF